MSDFKHRLFENRRVSVWGIGYLGYTTLLMLQAKGFCADVFDYHQERLADLAKGRYLVKKHKEAWSSKGEVPSIDPSKVAPLTETDRLFENCVHIISFPGRDGDIDYNRLQDLAADFLRNKEKIQDALILFQSAEVPGDIEKYFIHPLLDEGVTASFATAFRTDWNMEEFYDKFRKQYVAGHDAQSVAKAKDFFRIFNVQVTLLSSFREAEIYECARRSLQYTISSFVNQLVLAYPDSNIRSMLQYLVEDIQVDDVRPSIGTLGFKAASAVGYLLEGSSNPNRLSMVSDAEVANISAILNYAEIIKRMGIRCVVILGISEKGDQKEIRMAPSLILAEHLIAEGMDVRLHDPYFTPEEIRDLLPGVHYFDLAQLSSPCECLVMMTDHRGYRYFTQKDINALCDNVRLVIDNPGVWKDFEFSRELNYHVPGDGTLWKLG